METLNIRTTLLSVSTAVLLTFAGCSSGGGGGGSAPVSDGGGGDLTAAPVKSATLSGTTGLSSAGSSSVSGAPARMVAMDANTSATPEGTATLIVDSNGDELFGGDDLTYSTPIIAGAFSFDSVGLNADANVTEAYLTVTVDGKTPYTKIVKLSDGDTFSVLAQTSSKPVLTEVFDLASLSQSARETSFLRFGIKNDGSGIQSFSKLMSLSEFKAMADANVSLEGGELSSSVIPTANLPKGLKSLTVEMQSYQSADSDDFAAFPGSLKGFGKDEGIIKTQAATGTSASVQLESAGFDLLKLTDENGNIVNLDNSSANASKLRTFAAGATCNGMSWTRYLRSSEVAIIKKWPDESTDRGYQVPIWSNDAPRGAWTYIGLATIPDINASSPYFTMCVDRKWQGYLNCDSPLATSRPKQICVSAQDQLGKMLGSIYLNGKKGGQRSYAYTRSYGDSKGLATIEIKDANFSGWKYTYSAALTGWSKVDINSRLIVPDTSNPDCDYDMNLTINNPYTTIAHVKVYGINDTAKAYPLDGKYVSLYSSDYSNYYSKSAYTSNGEATFEIKPDVLYKVTYAAGEAYIKANGDADFNEKNDTTREVYVGVQDVNKAPTVNVGIYNSYNISNETKELKFYVSARDANYDPITFDGLFFEGKKLTEGTHYTVTSKSQYDGYYYMRGVLKLDSGLEALLAARNTSYKLSAKVSDSGNLSQEDSNIFHVSENQAPKVSTLYLIDDYGRSYYPSSRNIPEGNFTFRASTYDREGDARDVFITIDGNAEQNLTTALKVNMSKGNHNITVRVKENATSDRRQDSKPYTNIHFGNHAPTLGYTYVSNISVNNGDSIQLTTTAYDSDYDDINVTATANGHEYNLTKTYAYGSTYRSGDIKVDANTTFSIKAYDGEDYSQEKNITVTLNTAPYFTKEANSSLVDKATFTDTAETFVCTAVDPDGTSISYQWFIDGVAQNSHASYYNYSLRKKFAAGDYNVSCEASDRDGLSISKDAHISVTVNQAPVFTEKLVDTVINVNTTVDFECNASDPEGTTVSYVWTKDGKSVGSNSTKYSYRFTTDGIYDIACTASDKYGKSATSSAKVTVGTPNYRPVFTNSQMSLDIDANRTVSGKIGFSDSDGSATISTDTTYSGFTLAKDGTYTYDSSAYATLAAGTTRELTINLILTDNEDAITLGQLVINIKGTYVTPESTLKKDVTDLISDKSAKAGATVADAKNMFAQLRETAVTFGDIDNPEANSSTIIGGQINMLQTKIQPAIDAIGADFNQSAITMQKSVESFGNDIETDFNATIQSVMNRVKALSTKTETYADDENWSVTAGNDALSHTTTVNTQTMSRTDVYTLNGESITIVTTVNTNGDVIPTSLSTNGTISLSGTGYDLNVTTLSFSGGKATLKANGLVTGANSAKMTLTTLDLSLNVDPSKQNIAMFSNIALNFDGTLTAGGRTLVGKLALNESLPSVLDGTYTGLNNEPSFVGKVTLKTSLNSLLSDEAINDDATSLWTPLLMVHFSDATESFVTSWNFGDSSYTSDENGSTSVYNYTFNTQSDRSATCQVIDSYHTLYTSDGNVSGQSYDHNVSCKNGVTLSSYSTYNGKVTAQFNGVEKIVNGAWTDYKYDNGNSYNVVKLDVENEGETYTDNNGTMRLNGQPITVSNIKITPSVNMLDRTFDFKFDGNITDGSKNIVATFGVNRAVETQIYAQNILITNGTSSVKADSLSLTLKNDDFLMYTAEATNDYSYYYNDESQNQFESYSYTWNSNNYNNQEGPDNLYGNAKVVGLKAYIVGTNSVALTLNADAILDRNSTNVNALFDGTYQYAGTTFVGHIDANATMNKVTKTETDGNGYTYTYTDDELLGTANVSGSIESNGFKPFDITATVTTQPDENFEGYAKFTRDNSYELGIYVNQDNNSTSGDKTIVVNLGDNNGVLGSLTKTSNSKTGVENKPTLNVTNSSGTSLATYGEAVNGNEWEIVYSDNTSETLF